MRPIRIAIAVAAASLLAATAATAKPEGKGKPKGKPDDTPSAAEYAPGHQGGKPRFADDERSVIEDWFRAHPEARSELPPGLAKKNKLPPGWQKKLSRGSPIPDDVWEHRVPLPREIIVKLPPPPPGVITVRIHDKIVRVVEKTHELLDEIGLPHP